MTLEELTDSLDEGEEISFNKKTGTFSPPYIIVTVSYNYHPRVRVQKAIDHKVLSSATAEYILENTVDIALEEMRSVRKRKP